jgi:hypothetical protein
MTDCQHVAGDLLFGRRVAYVSCPTATYVVDVEDSPRIIAIHKGGGADIDVHKGFLYSCGQIVDVSSPGQWEVATSLTGGYCHNLDYDPVAKQLYTTHPAGSTYVYDLSPYANPGEAPSVLAPAHTLAASHDVVGVEGILFPSSSVSYAFPESGGPPQEWARLQGTWAGGGFGHTTWPTRDLRFVVAATEGVEITTNGCTSGTFCLSRGGLTLFEINIGDPEPLVGTYRDYFLLPVELSGSAHKPTVVGDYVYASYYQAGLQILKIDRKHADWDLQAFFDTSTEEHSWQDPTLTAGAFDVYADLGADRILVIDSESGLWVLEHTTAEALASYLAVY